MDLDLNVLTEAQLLALNRRIVERLKYLQQTRTHQTMMKFSVGERVGFETREGRFVSGTLVRFNKKTVTVISDEHQQWNVAPVHLRRVIE
ncbi:MAG: hypothetical protein MUF07_07145 [Steroidobacteraceae bacterium]|jgi:hypothetical protein|nr:hypothetical protein [Steroidobacteraceae bacterium]